MAACVLGGEGRLFVGVLCFLANKSVDSDSQPNFKVVLKVIKCQFIRKWEKYIQVCIFSITESIKTRKIYILFVQRRRKACPVFSINCHTFKPVTKSNITSSTFVNMTQKYRGVDKSLTRPTSRCILFDGENISFDASLVIYINSTNIPPIMIINRIHEN